MVTFKIRILSAGDEIWCLSTTVKKTLGYVYEGKQRLLYTKGGIIVYNRADYHIWVLLKTFSKWMNTFKF
jgi:hypothetical protein